MNQEKFENLVLAICEQVNPQPLYTVKLNKLIWLLDKTAMLQQGRTLTGIKYIKNFDGPVPFLNHDLFAEMKKKKLLKIEKDNITDREGKTRPRRSFSALGAVDWSVFSKQEHSLIQTVLRENKDKATARLVDLSPDIVWASVEDMEEIPMEAYLSTGDLDDSLAFQRSITASENYYWERVS